MKDVFPATFYAATARPADARRVLAHEIETDVCVIGGGFAGLWAARALLARGREVVVIEAGKVAGEASGQNGGFVSAGYAERLATIVERVGIDHARELYRLSRDGVEIVRSMLAEGDFGLDAVPGRLNVLRHDDEVGLRDAAEMLARDFDHDLVVWPRERVREALASDRYYQALHEADAFHLHPLNLARALAADIERRGGVIYEESRAVAADLEGLRKSVSTEKGRVRAFEVVIAGSAFLGEAFPTLAATVLPVRTHIVVTAPLGDLLKETIRYPGAIADTRRAGNYYRVIGDRLLWGGRITTNSRAPKHLGERMAEDILKVYPQLGEVPIDYAWSGTMGYAVHKMPQLGMVRPGVWIASAFGGHGLNTSAMAGDLIASAVVEQDDRWRLFIPFGLVWAGGFAGRAATQISYWSMQLKDWADETQTKRVERVQADIAAGLAPGIAAHAARRAKRKFVESSAGRASARFAAASYLFLSRVLVGVRWAGAILHALSAAIGRVLYVAIMAIATVIGFIASWVGWGMEMIAAAIVVLARATGKAAVLFWRSVAVPFSKLTVPAAKWAWQRSRLGSSRLAVAAQKAARWSAERGKEAARLSAIRAKDGAIWSARKIAAFSQLAWDRAILPSAKRAAVGAAQAREWVKSDGVKLARRAGANAVLLGAWSAKLPGIVWRTALVPAGKYALDRAGAAKTLVADARKRRAEMNRPAAVASPESKEEVPSRAEPAAEPITKALPEEAVSPQPVAVAEAKALPEEAASPQPVAAEEAPSPKPKKKKKAKAKEDSVEA